MFTIPGVGGYIRTHYKWFAQRIGMLKSNFERVGIK